MDDITLQGTLEKIPPEAWPLIETMLTITMVVVGLWILISIFVFCAGAPLTLRR